MTRRWPHGKLRGADVLFVTSCAERYGISSLTESLVIFVVTKYILNSTSNRCSAVGSTGWAASSATSAIAPRFDVRTDVSIPALQEPEVKNLVKRGEDEQHSTIVQTREFGPAHESKASDAVDGQKAFASCAFEVVKWILVSLSVSTSTSAVALSARTR